MQENLHRARTLLSSRMDDVRALKRMISETKDTLEYKRRQRLLQEIREQAAANAEAQALYHLQEEQSKSKERLGSAVGSQRIGSNVKIPTCFFGGPNKIQMNHATQ